MKRESEATPRPEARPRDRSKAEARDKAFAWRPKTDRGTENETEARPMQGRGEAEARPRQGRCEAAARPRRGRGKADARPMRGRGEAEARPMRGRGEAEAKVGMSRPRPDRCGRGQWTGSRRSTSDHAPRSLSGIYRPTSRSIDASGSTTHNQYRPL